MVAPYGFGISDFTAVGTLAWQVFKAAKNAPHSFHAIHVEVLSLYAVLKEAEETFFKVPFRPERQMRIKTVVNGCASVLSDLQRLVCKYESLGLLSKGTWDRIRWGNEDITELRARLIWNVTMLMAVIRTSQRSVFQKLETLTKDCQRGRREGSITSVQTVDSLSKGDRAVWRALRKELETIGITANEFEANRNSIFDWFKHAVNTGAFEGSATANKRTRSETSSAVTPRSPETPPMVTEGGDHTVDTVSLISDPFNDISSTRSATDAPSCRASTPLTKAESNEIGDAEEKKRVPRLALLIAAVSRPKVLLMESVRWNDHRKILRNFSRPAICQLLDTATMDSALLTACSYPCSKPTVLALLQNGADVHTVETRMYRQKWDVLPFGADQRGYDYNPLMLAAFRGNSEVVEVLLGWGAKIDHHQSSQLCKITTESCLLEPLIGVMPTPLGCGSAGGNLGVVEILLSAGADVSEKIQGRTALHEACRLTGTKICQKLLKRGVEVDSCCREGTPLMFALLCRQHDTVRLLLKRGANPNHKMNIPTALSHKTPLDVAMWVANRSKRALIAQDLTAIELLLEYGAVLDIPNAKALTELRKRAVKNP